MTAAPTAITAAEGKRGPAPRASGEARAAGPGLPEPRWLSEVRLRAARRVLWLRQLWSGQGYSDEHLLAISHSEVDRALTPRPAAADAERAFYRSDERAQQLSAEITTLPKTKADGRLEHIVGTFGLSGLEVALLTLALASAADHAIGRVFGYLLDGTEAADPTPALAAVLFDLRSEPPPGPHSALVRWLLAAPVVAHGGDTLAWTGGWRADALLLPALMGATDDWSAGCTGQVVAPPAGPVVRPDEVAEIADFVQALGPPGKAGLPIEIELAGAPGSGRTTLAAQAAAKLGRRLIAVDVATLAAGPDVVAAATREVRRAQLDGAVIAWEHAEAMPPVTWQQIPPTPLSFLSVPSQVPGAADVAGTPLTGELNWKGLARELDLNGAGIKSVALAAAFLAWSDGSPITERYVLAAARRELAKQGVVVRAGQMEQR